MNGINNLMPRASYRGNDYFCACIFLDKFNLAIATCCQCQRDLTLIMATVVLVTGGTGLVGKALQQVIAMEPAGSRFGKKPDETWIFASSSEADLRSPLSS